MKNTEKNQMNQFRVLRRRGLKKRLSAFLALLTVISMLSGQLAFIHGAETDSTYALAGEGSGEDITVHFGEAEDQHISIHVNPESDAEALADYGSEASDDETESETEIMTGIKEVEAGELVTIAPADGSDLPEEAEAAAGIVEGEEAIAAVEEKFPEEGSDETSEAANAQTTPESAATSSADGANTDSSESTGEAAITETQYQVFDISLENVDTEQYEDGFKVSVNLPEDIKGARDFHLYHLHEGEEPEEIEISTVGSVDKKTGLEVVSGFEFVTEGFSEFVLKYTVDFFFNGYGFSIKGGDAISLKELAEKLHMVETVSEDDSKQVDADSIEILGERQEVPLFKDAEEFIAEIENVEFSNPELLWVGKVEEDGIVYDLLQRNSLSPVFPYGTTDREYRKAVTKAYSAPDWILISLLPFDTEEALTITLKNGNAITMVVTDDQDAVMISDGQGGEIVQTIKNPAGTTIDLFDYWVSDSTRNTQGRSAWPGSTNGADDPFGYNFTIYHYDSNGNQGNQSNGGDWETDSSGNSHIKHGRIRGTGNWSGINSGHLFKFLPSAETSVIDGTLKDGGTPKNCRDGSYTINSWTATTSPTQGLVEKTLSNGYPYLTTNSTLGSQAGSLDYLFTPYNGTGKQYMGKVDGLLYVDPNGYYTYDSRDYSANYSGGNFILRKQTSDDSEAHGFWPFGDRVYWHGMHMNAQFSMPTGGQVLNPKGVLKDMEFEFSGDDDCWVYIDGVLIGDAGGVHLRSDININFKTGAVSVTGQTPTTLKALFTAAGKANTVEWDGDTFAAGTYHTFDMFYLERGGGESNLRIHYNLVSTADFTGHKAYYGEDENARLARDQFQFEMIGLDGRYESVPDGNGGYTLAPKSWNNGSYSLAGSDQDAIMPNTASADGAGTVASPKYIANSSYIFDDGSSVNAQLYVTGVSEDGNINFGDAAISEAEKYAVVNGHNSVYRYVIREIIPDAAVNADGITWEQAKSDPLLRKTGGFKYNDITYDNTVYYMSARVISWTGADGYIRYGLSKTYYTDDTFTTKAPDDVTFVSFLNAKIEPLKLKVVKKSKSGRNLPGAKFSLGRAKKNEENGKWVVNNNIQSVEMTSDASGELTFTSLVEGSYILEETKPPQGYVAGSATRWLVTMTRVESTKTSQSGHVYKEISLVPIITPLDSDGNIVGEAEHPTVDNSYTFQHTVLNDKLPRGDISVEKQWIKADGETAYTAEELADLEAAKEVTVTGELARRYLSDAGNASSVTIKGKWNADDTDYSNLWSGQVEPGTSVKFAAGVNKTQIYSSLSVSTGQGVVESAEEGNYESGGRTSYSKAYTLQNITQDTIITIEFPIEKYNGKRLSFKMIESTPPSSSVQPGTWQEDQGWSKPFTLKAENEWSVTWTAQQLNESGYDYEYYLKNVSETTCEGFTFISTPTITTDNTSGVITMTLQNIKDAPMTDLFVRKAWTDGADNHVDGTIHYKLQRTEYDTSGNIAAGPYDYVEVGQSSAILSLSANDIYNNVPWQRHHEKLPANNGKEEADPNFRSYKYSVVETDVPAGYTVSYDEIIEDGNTIKIIRNTPDSNKIEINKQWVADDGSTPLTSGIPSGAYITGTLKRSYSWQEASGVAVTIKAHHKANNKDVYTSIFDGSVAPNTDIKFWGIAQNGMGPVKGVTGNSNNISPSGETIRYDVDGKGWIVQPDIYKVTITEETEIIMDFEYQIFHYGEVTSYTPGGTGDGELHTSDLETVGIFRLDATNGWTWVWTDTALNETAGRDYTYIITDVKELTTDGTDVTEDGYPGFDHYTGGSFTVENGKWNAVIVNKKDIPTKDFSFTKLWRAAVGETRVSWPSDKTITVKIKQDSSDYATYTVSNGDLTVGKEIDANQTNKVKLVVTAVDPHTGYVFSLTGLPYGEGQEGYTYYVSEDPVSGYQSPKYYKPDGSKAEGAQQIGDGGTIANDLVVYILPATGGPGTMLIYLLGFILTTLAGMGIVMRRKRR